MGSDTCFHGPVKGLRVVSYNIRKAIGADRRRDPERILTVLAETGADIAVLQEADLRWGSRHSALPLPLLLAHGWQVAPFAAHPGGIGWHGNSVLVRDHVRVVRHTALTLPALEPRGAIMAELAAGHRRLRLVGMHLDLSGIARRRQARHILLRLRAEPPLPTILTGDLNEWRREAGVIRDFCVDHLCLATAPSFPALRPFGKLDRIFVGPGVQPLASGVHATPLARIASDHLPVWADLAIAAS